MAIAQLRDVPAGLATPSGVDDNAAADIPGGSISRTRTVVNPLWQLVQGLPTAML